MHFENGFFENFANFWRARSRLYQNEILQENMRSTAFFKLYKICILLHRCNLKIFAKNWFEKTAIFVKFQQKFCKCRKIRKIRCSSSKTSYRIRKCVFHLPSLVEPERLTGSDKWAMPETRANLIVVRPLLARAPLTAKLISRAT